MNLLFLAFISVTAPYEDITAVNFGMKFGYQYENLTLKEVKIIKCDRLGGPDQNWDSTYKPVGKVGESKTLTGFGGEIIAELVMALPGLPIGVEVDLGHYTSGYDNHDSMRIPPVDCYSLLDTVYVDMPDGFNYTITSTRVSLLGKLFIRSWEGVYPWIGIGPFVGLNTHIMRVNGELAPYENIARASTGVCGEIGARIWIIPKLSVDAGVRLDYFTNSVASFKLKEKIFNTEYTFDFKYSQLNARVMVGAHYLFQW